MSQNALVLDYETRSRLELRGTPKRPGVGAVEYARHKSTKLLCAGWKYGPLEKIEEMPTRVWSPAIPSSYGELKRALLDPAVILVAHNAFFEQMITRYVLSLLIHDPYLREIPHERWICTASLARAVALPGKLEHVCEVLKLPVQKDMEGHKLMLKMSKPRKPTKNNPSEWHNSIKDLKRLMQYCGTDVDAEALLLKTLPPLIPFERKVWVLDQKINYRGVCVDRPLVVKILGMIAEETKALNAETVKITGGRLETTNQRAQALKCLADMGCSLPNFRAGTIVDALDAGLAEGPARRLLEIRQAVSKTSTAKYVAFDVRSRSDGRVRDLLVYNAAKPTGRWGGAGLQPQNFPRGSIKNTWQAAELITHHSLDTIRLVYGDPMEAFSSCLRSMIMATPGKEIFCGDFNAIETRVLFWLAGEKAGLKAFHEGADIYKIMAARIYGVPVEKVTDAQRELGKRAVLGCGYGMGWKKFKETCKTNGNLIITEDLAKAAVNAYRALYVTVRRLWSNYESAAIYAVQNRGKKVTINKTTWWVSGKFLYCQLPSGRRLAYYGPEIRHKMTPWGEKAPMLMYWGEDSYTKKWRREGTYGGKITENVVQAVARDLMAEAMVRIEDAGYEVTLTVHDEVKAEREKGKGTVGEFTNLMAALPGWADGCPVKVKAWCGPRYKK